MSLLSVAKRVLIRPFQVDVPIDMIGTADSWGVLRGSLTRESRVVSAGVGKSVTFEEHISNRFGARVILLDPSPTGAETMTTRVKSEHDRIDFRPLGLAGVEGVQFFGLPDHSEEGSFKKSALGEISFRCTTVKQIMREENFTKLDLLKIDIEGFEYEVLESVFADGVGVDQICVEIHSNRSIQIEQSVVDAYHLIRRVCKHGYRVIYNKAMDFTFARVELLAMYR